MNRLLVAYSTNSGSTAEVAQAVADALKESGAQVDLRRFEEVTALEPYQGVVVGAPMILGWHRPALRFLKQHQQALSSVPLACFCTAMSLTVVEDLADKIPPVFIDPWLAKAPKNPQRLSFKENYATVGNYLKPVFKAAPNLTPLSIAFFGGKLELFRLKFFQMLFVMLIIQAQPGDLRNWDAIRSWAQDLASQFSR